MERKLFALLVGIDTYPATINNLHGCVSDVNLWQEYLTNRFDPRIETLINSDATRKNIIDLFRNHLCKAGESDVVLFHFSGHGSRELSAPQFKEYYPDKKDETLVCCDSRNNGGLDLADKELAVLLWEVAQKKPHIAVILDCCHSGSGTREADDFSLAGLRQTPERKHGTPRPIETYLDGQYKEMTPINIPKSKHVLMAACDRTQKAWETNDRNGLFTRTLIDVLLKSSTNISYADLFVRCRSAILKNAKNQTPQFETYYHFLPYSKFLDGQPLDRPARYFVYPEKDEWKMDCGAIHGLPTEPGKKIEVALYSESPRDTAGEEIAGYAETVSVGAQKSILKLYPDCKTLTRYKAEIVSLPVSPIPVYLDGDEEGKKILKDSMIRGLNFIFTDEQDTARYVLSARNDQFLLIKKETGALIQGAEGEPEKCIIYIFSVLENVIRWDRSLALQNFNTAFNPGNVDLKFFEVLDDGNEWEYDDNEITLDFVKLTDEWKPIRAKLRIRNRTNQELHFTLVYFSQEFGIHILKNDPIIQGDDWVTLWGDGENDYLYLPENINEAVDIFKLIVTTERMDDYLMVQDDLEPGKIVSFRGTRGETEEETRAIGTRKPIKKLITNDWFTNTVRVKTVRRQDRVSENDTSLADGQIIVKGHPSLKANMCLSGGRSQTRSVEHKTISNVFEGEGFDIIHFSSTRGEDESILELTDICNEESLKENPLEIVLKIKPGQNECVLPVTFDGTHFLPVGNPAAEKNGIVSIRIDHIPCTPDENRRSMGKALKLCFLKLILGRKDVYKIKWVEYEPEGTIIRHEDNVKEKVAKANNILLLIHGIIGDTEPIAKSLKLTVDETDKSIADKYDLILTFDYENLNTSLERTAKTLKQKLKEAGLHEDQNRRITILAHSMGGLVSRWFIEQEGGNQIVKHLIMAGTPNNGSVLGNITAYRNMAITALTLSLNFIKPLIAYASALLITLNQSKKMTCTLEQMKEDSEFVRDLSLSSDPNVRYIILAGDITHYEVDEERFFARLIEKIEIGIGKLFYGDRPNDIAVSVESIKHVDDYRSPGPEKIDLVCHHLNYFASEAGLNSLKKLLIPGKI